MDPSTVIEGPCYVIKVKPVKGYWASDDLLYGVVVKGASRFGFIDFQRLCEEANKRFFISFKIVDKDCNCTWKDCLDMMEDRPPKGSPWVMMDKMYSFSEAAAAAYQQGFFTDQKGLETLGRLTAPSSSSKLVKLVTGGTRAPSNQYMLEVASQSSQSLGNIQKNCDLPPELSSQGTSQLVAKSGSMFDIDGDHSMVPEVASNETVEAEREVEEIVVSVPDDARKEGAGQNVSVMVEQMELDSLKECVNVTAAKLEAANLENVALNEKVLVLQGKLKTSEEQGARFMAELDKHQRSLHLVNNDIAAAVVEKIAPKFGPLVEVARKTLGQVEALTASVKSGDNALREFRARVDSCFDSVSDGVSTIKDILGAHGLSEGEEEVNLPEAVKYVFDMTRFGAQNIGTPTRDEQVQNVCYYVIHGSPAVMICQCGCGYSEVRESFVECTDEGDGGDGNDEPAEGVNDDGVMGGSSDLEPVTVEKMDFSVPPPLVGGNQLTTQSSSFVPPAQSSSSVPPPQSSSLVPPPIVLGNQMVTPSSTKSLDPKKFKNKNFVKRDDKRKSGTQVKAFKSEQAGRGKPYGGRRLDFPSPVSSSRSGRGYKPPFIPQQTVGSTTQRGGAGVWKV